MRTKIFLKNKFLVSLQFLFLFSVFTVSRLLPQSANVITLDASATFQTIVGWEAMGWIAHFDTRYQIENVDKWKDVVADMAANEVGINRVRLEVRSGSENPVDYFGQYLSGQIARSGWTSHWYEIINDNDDPFTINSVGFHFSELDYTIEKVVLPLKNRVEANGEKLYVNLTYVDFDGSTFEHYSNPDEYAELILATFQHMEGKYGWVPDGVEVILEPDVARGWSANQVGQCLLAAGERLESNGYMPDFIAPSNTSMSNALNYFDDIIQIAGISRYIQELSYHRYGGVSTSTLQQIAQRGETNGIGTSMLEWWNNGNTYRTLHKDLKMGNNTAWQRGVLAEIGRPNTKEWLFTIDDSNRDNPQVIMNNGTKYLRQYFRYIRQGAVRIEALSNNSAFDPLAFINVDGKYVVVVKASTGGTFSLEGLPSGRYGIKYTTGNDNNPPSAYNVDLADAVINAGDTLKTMIPEAGVLTVYARFIPNELLTKAVINEVVTDPQQNWNDPRVPPTGSTLSDGAFNRFPGLNSISNKDEWLELMNVGQDTIDLGSGGWRLEFIDSTPETLDFATPDSNVAFVFSAGGSLNNFQPGEHLVVGDPPGDMDDSVFVKLRMGDLIIDDVEFGNDFEGDGPEDGAPAGTAIGIEKEAVARVPNGVDSNSDRSDFVKQAATIGFSNNDTTLLVPEIAIEPDSIDFGDVLVGENKANGLNLHNRGLASLVIQNTEFQGQNAAEFSVALATPVALLPQHNLNLTVNFNPATEGTKRAFMVVESNAVGENLLRVALSGKGAVVLLPEITVTPGTYDFGIINPDSIKVHNFFLSNAGQAVLEISDISFGGKDTSDFDILGSTQFVLNPADSIALPLRFVPQSSGAKKALLQISSNDPDEGRLDVPVSGYVNWRPSPPIPVQPSTSDTVKTFIWTQSTDPDSTLPIHYEFSIGKDSLVTQQVFQIANLADTSISVDVVANAFFFEADSFYYWRVKAVDSLGAESAFSATALYQYRDVIDQVTENPSPSTPKAFSLAQNYPNPFNLETVIRFELPGDAMVTLRIVDIRGREIRTLLNQNYNSTGVHTTTWNGRDDSGSDVASGVYFYTIKFQPAARGKAVLIQTRKLVLLK